MSLHRMFAVDFGASGGKCFAGRLENGSFSMKEIHRFAHEGVPFHLPDRRGCLTERLFWDDVQLYHQIILGLQEYRRSIGPELDSIGIDTWGADGCFFNADSEAIGNIYCYRDHRLDDMVDVIKQHVDAKRVYAITGIHFQPFNLSNQLHWFVTHRRDLLQPGVFFLPVPSVFYYYLGGIKAVDSSWASVTQLMDAKSRCWSTELLRALDIPAEILPPIVPPATLAGKLHAELAERLGITRAHLAAVGSHDTASAFAAAPVEDTDGALIISSGTWSLIGKLIPEPITTPAAMNANLSNEGGIGNIRFLKNCMGQWIVQELRRVWRKTDGRELPWKEIDQLTLEAAPFAAFIDPDTPRFYNPSDMEQAMAEYFKQTGQAVPSSRGGFLRAAYESLALKYRLVNEQISAVCGQSTRIVHIVGGGSKVDMLNQFTANALALPVLAGPEEATAVGNLMAQAVALQALPSMAAAQPVIRQAFPIRRFEPQNTPQWDEAYRRFRRITHL